MAGTAAKPPVITVPTLILWGRHDPILKSEWADVLGDYFSDIQAISSITRNRIVPPGRLTRSSRGSPRRKRVRRMLPGGRPPSRRRPEPLIGQAEAAI
jgi:hypothetical protein